MPEVDRLQSAPDATGAARTHADLLTCEVRQFDAGRVSVPPRPSTLILLHLGGPNKVVCRRQGMTYRGTELYGDIDLVPSGVASQWDGNANGTSLALRLPDSLLASVASAADIPADRIQLRSAFQVRDPQIEHIGLALKSELEAGQPGGRLFRDALATALAARLVHRYEVHSLARPPTRIKIGRAKLRRILEYIETHLAHDLGLADIAAVADMSMSHLKVVFRHAMGMPVHQYIVRRRVQYAERLLAEGTQPISEVALAAGFAHQSHLAKHLRRLRGATPSSLRRQSS